jgi:hypothetical protein
MFCTDKRGFACHAGISQQKQGDPEAALQSFSGASADALSAAGLPMPVTSRWAAGFDTSLSTQASATTESLSGHTCWPAAAVTASSASSLGASAGSASVADGPLETSSDGPDPAHAAPASISAQQRSMADSTAAGLSASDRVGAFGVRPASESVLAERTAVRVLMAQASVLKQLGRLKDAMHALDMASVLDQGVEVHRQQLQAEIERRTSSEVADNSGKA